MQFERIRKNHKRKIIIGGLILVCVISAITITTTRAKYKLTEDIPLVRGSINYKSYDFKVMAMYKSDDKINYIEINEMPSEGYSINEEKSYCNLSNGNKDTTAVLKTIDGNHTIGKLKKSDRCYLYFDKRLDITISDIISANNPKETVPDFSQIATADEGMFKTSDGMYGGYSYYWRGSVTNNYVKFGGFCWRIIRINGDGSMRLIYDGSSCHANGTNTTESFVIMNQSYNSSSDRSEYVGYTYTIGSQRTLNGTASNLKAQNETWYNNNIENNIAYASKIADGKYCNDRDIQTGSNWTATGDSFYYAGYKRLNKDYSPKLSCNLSDVYTLKVGAITADEVVMAGGKVKTSNVSYYLHNGNYYWTMTPSYWSNGYIDDLPSVYEDPNACEFAIESNGQLYARTTSNRYSGIRPVINLKSDTEFQAGGNGTLENPYVVT